MKKRLPVFLGFFVMGFVDVVGISTNYAKKDLQLSDSVANLLPLMVFIWFALFSVPTGVLMNRIGRRRTVLLGIAITLAAMLLASGIHLSPLSEAAKSKLPSVRSGVDPRFLLLLAAFALLGIGNTILQVALNPLLGNVIASSHLTSALTGGQLIKALASFLGPIIAGAASAWWGDWKVIFWILAAVSTINLIWLWLTPINEGAPDPLQPGATVEIAAMPGSASSSERLSPGRDSLRLLANPVIARLVIGVVCIVGLDVGFNTSIPQFLTYRCGFPLEKAGLGTSLYFIARTLGSLIGVFLLAGTQSRRFLLCTAGLGIVGLAGILLSSSVWLIGIMIFLSGLAVANVFPILFAAALQQTPTQQNEVSGLMIMGVAGGAILLPIMGLITDHYGALAALAFLLLPWIYLAWLRKAIVL